MSVRAAARGASARPQVPSGETPSDGVSSDGTRAGARGATILQQAGTFWRTVRHLRPVQVYGRVWFRVRRPRPELAPAPPRRACDSARWAMPARRAPSLIAPTVQRFLGESRDLDVHGWDDPRLEKLWRYNQHYFDDLNAAGAASRATWHAALVDRWVRENPPAVGTGWEPYPTSLRVVNWIKWAMGGGVLPPAAVDSLAVQARWLARRLEVHLLGNHLFVNAKALVLAGLFFDGPEAAGWRRTGLAILARELPEQVLSDGGHFELSPMYHALALEDVFDLLNMARTVPDTALAEDAMLDRAVREWHAVVGPMRRWLRALVHPDGEVAFFNDSAPGIAPAPAELEAYARALGLPEPAPLDTPITWLPAAGFVRVASGDAVALLDVGEIGASYVPAHGHADVLSFELSLGEARVLVNSGTSCYGTSAERVRQRGTSAHNTVVVEGRDSSEVWGGFRVGRRARPRDVEVRRDAGAAPIVAAAHDGYAHLPGAPVHRREWRFMANALEVVDTVEPLAGRAGTRVRAESHLHLHPAVRPVGTVRRVPDADGGDAEVLDFALPDGRRLLVRVRGGRLALEPATWHPGFGCVEATHKLRTVLTGSRLVTCLSWSERP